MSVLPTSKTPIERCEYKSLHTCTMLRKFAHEPKLSGLADKLEAATSQLLAQQAIYREKTKALLILRVEVKYVDLISDQAVRTALKVAEIADGKAKGRIASMLYPGGSTPIIKPVGGTQVKEMRALEGRYIEVGSIWSEAQSEGAKLKALRQRYEDALVARATGMEVAAQARAARNLAKEEFLDVFTEVANRIRAAFPRDKKTQDLFFLRDRMVTSVDDVGEDEESEESDAES